MSPITETAIKIFNVYLTNEEVRNKVNTSPEFYRALVHETGIISNPNEFEDEQDEDYDALVFELERLESGN